MTLDISLLDTYNPLVMAVADTSHYTPEASVQNPFLEITPPGFSRVILEFVPRQVNVLNSVLLGLSTPQAGMQPLPDGVWKIRYAIRPHYQNYVERYFLRFSSLLEKFDTAILRSLTGECENDCSKRSAGELDKAWTYLQGAIAAANLCDSSHALTLYQKATQLLEDRCC